MTKEDLVILYLSISLMVTQWFWVRAEKRASYLDGRASVYAEMAEDPALPSGTCFAHKGKC